MLRAIVAACLVGLGLSIKALPPAGEDPAAREDQLRRADCRDGLLVFEAATWLVKETMPFKRGGPQYQVAEKSEARSRMELLAPWHTLWIRGCMSCRCHTQFWPLSALHSSFLLS